MLARTIVIRMRTATMKVMKTKFFLKSFIFRVECAHFNVKMALVGKKLVEQMIKSKALVVISKSYCPFCHKVIIYFPICITIQTLVWSNDMMTYQAKAALNNYKINPDNFEWLEIEDREDCNEIQVFRFFLWCRHENIFFRLTWSSWLGPALCREFSSEDLVLEAVMKPQLLTGLQPLWLSRRRVQDCYQHTHNDHL